MASSFYKRINNITPIITAMESMPSDVEAKDSPLPLSLVSMAPPACFLTAAVFTL
jgi:hypothetical protein